MIAGGNDPSRKTGDRLILKNPQPAGPTHIFEGLKLALKVPEVSASTPEDRPDDGCLMTEGPFTRVAKSFTPHCEDCFYIQEGELYLFINHFLPVERIAPGIYRPRDFLKNKG